MTTSRFDIAIVGAGILGLAHALAASRLGLKVLVLDRDARANGSSIRNFGFVTVTGQAAGATWRRAMRSRDVWAEVSPEAGIEVLLHGTHVVAHNPLSRQVLEEFVATDMGERCKMLDVKDVAALGPAIRADRVLGVMYSPFELRVEARTAVPRLAAWLEAAHGVTIVRNAHVHAIDVPRIDTSAGTFYAQRAVACPNTDLYSLFADRIAAHNLRLTKLQMLRLSAPPWRLTSAVMSDFGLVRYLGYHDCPSQPALVADLENSEPLFLEAGIHLIAVQSADGTLVVGDSHVDDRTPDPFASSRVDELMLRLASRTLDLGGCQVLEHWIGMYPVGDGRTSLVETPSPGVRLVMVTSGTGMSTSFALAEEVIAELVGSHSPVAAS